MTAEAPDRDRYYDRIARFDVVERSLHWANATLVLILLVTGTTFYVGGLQEVVGHRVLLRQIHVWSGIALVVPWTIALAGRWRGGLVLDLMRHGRWTHDDWRWLASRGRRARDRVGKFNGGQKLNAVFVGGALPVMLMTGALMKWHDPFADSWRTGATFVHDVIWFILCFVIVGHILKALAEPEAMWAMVRGWVPGSWARKHRPLWFAEVRSAEPPADQESEPEQSGSESSPAPT